MCDPISIGLAIASTALQVVTANQAASATNKAIQAQADQRKKEIDQAATAEINDRLRAKRREQGRIMVAAGESGLNLNSGGVEALLMDSNMQASLANQQSLANRESRRAAADAEAQANMQSMTTPLGAGLQIALSGATAAFGAGTKKKK